MKRMYKDHSVWNLFDDVAGSDISRSFLQTAEEEDEVTGLSNGDMGLQARALYDYQAGKLYWLWTLLSNWWHHWYGQKCMTFGNSFFSCSCTHLHGAESFLKRYISYSAGQEIPHLLWNMNIHKIQYDQVEPSPHPHILFP